MAPDLEPAVARKSRRRNARRLFLLGQGMTAFSIHATKGGQSMTTVRIGPTVTVAKARALLKDGWQVHVTDAAGQHYEPAQLDQLLTFDRIERRPDS
jgi:hypothetical protein